MVSAQRRCLASRLGFVGPRRSNLLQVVCRVVAFLYHGTLIVVDHHTGEAHLRVVHHVVNVHLERVGPRIVGSQTSDVIRQIWPSRGSR